MIKLVNVWHHYGIRPVLKNINIRIDTGELVVLMGPNGMGKSTLLGLIGGILSPIKGHIEINGLIRRNSVEEETVLRKKVIYLPDDPFLPLSSTGREYILAVGRLYGIDETRLMEHTELLLELFDLAKEGDSPISSCSSGQKKKIGLCAALVSEWSGSSPD